MDEKEVLTAKFKKIGNPIFIFKMIQDIRKFLNQHQVIFPQTGEFDSVFLIISNQAFEVYQGGVLALEVCPEKGAMIRISSDALCEVSHFLGIQQEDEQMMTQLLKKLRQLKYLKQYQTILQIVDESFETNLKMKDVFKLILRLF